jgi:TrmH family RNA methyltransferase
MTPTELDRLRVVLVGTRNPLNVGAAARAMSNFGFSRLRVVAPYDVAFREARSAVGAPEVLKNAEEYQNVADAVADCGLVVGTTDAGNRVLEHPLKSLEEGGLTIRQALATGPAALLFGSEKRGLATNDFSHCHWLMHIPTRHDHLSMNLGQAVAVCLYELARSGQVVPTAAAAPAAEAEELERMTQALFRVLLAAGYVKSGAEKISLEKMRRLVRRMQLSREDAGTWTGALRKVELALGRNAQDTEDPEDTEGTNDDLKK